jgi:hypothetical protein
MVMRISKANSLWVFVTLRWIIAPNLGVLICSKYPYENPTIRGLGRRSRRLPQASSQSEWDSPPPPS